MLQNAVRRHEQDKAAAEPASQTWRASQERASQHFNPGYRNPLNPATASMLNGARSFKPPNMAGGVKRTASGLAKAVDGSFDDGLGSQQNPIVVGSRPGTKGGLLQVTQQDFIDENDFDSDIDLDIEEPVPKKTASRPPQPQQRRPVSPPKPVLYPTLPRAQQAQPSFLQHADSGYASIEPAGTGKPPGSSASIPWSSSPIEHHNASLDASMIKSFAFKSGRTTNQAPTHSPPAPAPPKPAKRGTLPWLSQGNAEIVDDELQHPATSSRLYTPGKAAHTPKDNNKSNYPWNTTASAVKAQQKQHREETKRAIKDTAPDDEAIQKAKTANKRPARVFLSDEQQHVLDLVVEKKKSVFFTGSAGTGKSVLMREIITSLRKKYQREPDRVAVTASTGLAACNVGGVTLHSFAGIGLGKEDVSELVRKIKKNQKAKHRWMRTKVLVIDEVSMVDGDLFDKLEAIARQLRSNGRPFGGIQLVITGDFFQLPPVPDSGRVARFAFDAATWNTTIEHTIGLHHVFRQKDPEFAGMLNEMREGRLQPASIDAFRKLSRPLNFQDDLESTELFPTRNEVDNANNTKLHLLQGATHDFSARDGGAISDKGQRDKLLQNCMAPQTITLKKGAQVMLIKNIDETLVNGSLGKVVAFMDESKFDRYSAGEDGFTVKPDGTLASSGVAGFPGDSRNWPVVRFVIADGTTRDLLCQPESWKVELPNGEVQASRNQIPLILAWALSIHKAQGQTLERVKVDLGKVFEKGQAYVALSRATSMAGLQVLRFDPKKVVAHERVRTFYSQLARVELEDKEKKSGEGKGKKTGSMGGTGVHEYEEKFLQDGWAESP